MFFVSALLPYLALHPHPVMARGLEEDLELVIIYSCVSSISLFYVIVDFSVCVCVYIYIYTHVYTYIHICIERERDTLS